MSAAKKATVRKSSVTEITGGTMKCSRSACGGIGGWCEHLEAYVTSHQDAGAMEGLKFVTVPIFPSKDFWLQVGLGPKTDIGDFRQVSLACGQRTISLGFISPYEGRASLRTLVLDWLRAEAVATDRECTASTHRPRPALKGQEVLIDAWNLIVSGQCAYCSGFTNFSEDAPEL